MDANMAPEIWKMSVSVNVDTLVGSKFPDYEEGRELIRGVPVALVSLETL